MGIITDSWQVMSEGYLASLKTLSRYLPAYWQAPRNLQLEHLKIKSVTSCVR